MIARLARWYALGMAGALLVLASGVVLAAGAGEVTALSGTLTAQRPGTGPRILAKGSEVNPGDVLTTQADSYAQINFSDDSVITMRPRTEMMIESYSYTKDQPEADNAFFRLLKGGLRTVTGYVGKRGNQAAYRIGTSVATIGIRGSSGDTLDCTQGCDGVTSTSGKVERGVYHTTYTGSYVMQNDAGEQVIGEGQFGFARDPKVAPTLLPGDPGLHLDELPFAIVVHDSKGGVCDVR